MALAVRAVRHQHHRAPGHQRADGAHELAGGGRIKVRRRLVEQDEWRIAQEGARQRDALALPGRQGKRALAEPRIEAVRERRDEALGSGQPRCPADRLRTGIRLAERDVLGDRAGEQVRALRDPGDLAPPVGDGEVLDADAARADLAGRRLGESQQEPEQRALPGPARPGHREMLARTDRH